MNASSLAKTLPTTSELLALCTAEYAKDTHSGLMLALTWHFRRTSYSDLEGKRKAEAAEMFFKFRVDRKFVERLGYVYCLYCRKPVIDADDTDRFHFGCRTQMRHLCGGLNNHDYCIYGHHVSRRGRR